MNYYEKELKALKRSNRYRTREVVDNSLKDFASNDYLGFAHKKELFDKTVKKLEFISPHASKASMLVNGYHQVHKDFEEALSLANGFEDCVVLGSGFNANIALIEALVRKGDRLFLDEKYHASGVLASNLNGIDITFFTHNDTEELEELLRFSEAKRNIVAVEGIYSMDGDLCDKKIFDIVAKYDALLIVDEAHSSGVVGKKLMGVFDLYNIKIAPNHIKMGTLGKAYGSFGAYILASSHIVEYLLNRAKPIIYATSLSLFDTVLAHNALLYIQNNTEQLQNQITQRKLLVQELFDVKMAGLIFPLVIGNNQEVMHIKEKMLVDGYSIGAIRQPTVENAIVRVIARLGEDEESFKKLLLKLKEFVRC